MSRWYEVALSGTVIRRSLGYAVVVGGMLVAINHGDVLLAGDFTKVQWFKVLITPLVPYLVCTFSSVQAMCSMQATGD